MKNTTKKPRFQKFPQSQDLFLRLKNEVSATLEALSAKRQKTITLKAVLFPTAYLACYLFALGFGYNKIVLITCYMILGVLLVVNFLNLIHEAVHQTLFRRKWINSWYVLLFDLMGANSYVWKVRHTRLHHNYPNVMGWDSDFEQSPIARVFPHGPFTSMHRYQHIYLPVIYPLYLLNWLLVRDFVDFFNRNKLVWKVTTIPAVEYVKLFVFKSFFLFYTIVLPVIVLDISLAQSITAFLAMIFTASIISLIVLLSPHANTENDFPVPDSTGTMPSTWLHHQLLTTNDIEEDNWFTRHFMGCFNFHIAHHLFPNINHVYYPEVTAIIKRFSEENGLPYRRLPLRISLHNHYQLLRSNAFLENIFEETM